MGRVHEGPEPSDSPELTAYKEQCQESVNHHLARLCLLLKAAHIDEVHVTYGAGEDDGGIEDITYYRRSGEGLEPVEAPQLPAPGYGYGESELEARMYDVMESHGFYNQNEGCQGVIRWLIPEDMLIHDHQTNEYGEGEETEDGDRETLYVPNERQTFLGIDDVAFEGE